MRMCCTLGTTAIAAVVIAIAGLALAPVSVAQRPSVIAGQVVDSATGERLAGANVSIAGRAGETITGDAGTFVLPAEQGTRVHLVVRRIGYDSRAIAVDVASDTTRTVVRLVAVSQQLETVAVTAAPIASVRLTEYERRRLHPMGATYITHEEIEKRNPITTADLVRRAPSVTIMDSSGAQLVVSTRGPKMVVRGRNAVAAVPCVLRIGVDGSLKEPGFSLNQVAPKDIHGIEIFHGPSSIPNEYAGARSDSYCGLLMIWTRER